MDGLNLYGAYMGVNGRDPLGLNKVVKNAYEFIKSLLKKNGLNKLYQVHHKIHQTFFNPAKNPITAKFLQDIGYGKDVAKNLITLPNKQGVIKGVKGSDRALHAGGGHTKKYMDHIRKNVLEVERLYQGGLLTKEQALARLNNFSKNYMVS